MLSLLPPELQCDIHPQRLVLRRGNRMLGEQALTAQVTLDEALDQLLSAHNLAMPWWGKLSFCLSSSRIHYFTVPWQPGLSTPEELRSFAATEAARQPFWRNVLACKTAFISVQFGATALAAAIDEALWQTLLLTAHKWKLRVGGIHVALHQKLRAWRGALPADALFCLRDEQSTIFVSRQRGEWQQAWCLHNDAGVNAQQQVARTARLMGLDSAVTHYFLNNIDAVGE